MPRKNNKKRSKGASKKAHEDENITKQLEQFLKIEDDLHEDLGSQLRNRHPGEDPQSFPMPDFFKQKLDSLKEKTMAEDLVRTLCSRFKQESYDDGDQSPLKGDKGHIMESCWSTGFDYNPANPRNSHLSDWLKVVWRGDYSAMMDHVIKARREPSGLTKLLERRESGLNISAIFHVICGARVLYGDNQLFQVDKMVMSQSGLEMKYEHSKILQKLIDLGAKISARDVAGYTPLHHCLTAYGNKQTLDMAKILLKSGADPNLQNRFGASPLFECVMTAQYDSIELLLKYGADPNVRMWMTEEVEKTKGGKGLSCFEIAMNFPKVLDIFGSYRRKAAKAERTANRKAAGGSFRLCRQCNVDGDDNKRCTGCYLVWYCGLDCQRAGWEEHKKECKEVGDQYRLVRLMDAGITTKNDITGRIHQHTYGDLPSKKHFVVKVQVPLDVGGAPLFVYDKERGLCGLLARSKGQEEVYDELVTKVEKHGFGGLKGFFYAILTGTDHKNRKPEGIINIKLNSKQILPVETW